MIWCKTDAGRLEMQARALVKDRMQRSLLLLIDGNKTEEMLLANLAGIKAEDFQVLESLQLIALLPEPGRRGSSAAAARVEAVGAAESAPSALDDENFLDYGKFTAQLTKLISSELGLRGFTLTLAVEKAASIEQLREVADRVLDQIRARKGDATADQARRSLYG